MGPGFESQLDHKKASQKCEAFFVSAGFERSVGMGSTILIADMCSGYERRNKSQLDYKIKS